MGKLSRSRAARVQGPRAASSAERGTAVTHRRTCWDNETAGGRTERPDDPFLAEVNVQARCIWTTETQRTRWDVLEDAVARPQCPRP